MKDWSKAIHYCYTRLYNNSTPKAKWKELFNNAKTDKNGVKRIPFMKYSIEEAKLSKIVEDTIRKFKIRGYQKQVFKTTILLGCSPKTKLTKK